MKKLNHGKDFIESIHDLYYPAIAKQIRKDLKTVFEKDFKFSVTTKTYSGGGSIDISILKGNIDFYTKEYKELEKIYSESCHYEDRENLTREYSNRYTKDGKMIMDEIKKIHSQYNHDKSDSMTDYFDVNYYGNVEIGKWDSQYIKI